MNIFDFLMERLNPRRKSYLRITGGGMAGNTRVNVYQSAEARAAADVIARHGAKFHARIMGTDNRQIEDLLAVRPNPIMNAYDFQYKLIMQTLLKSNGFALALWDGSKLSALIPIDYSTCEAVTDNSGHLYLDFMLTNGKQLITDYDDIIHLRRFFAMSRVMGDDNSPLTKAVELNETLNAGLKSAVNVGSTLRGLLKLQKKAMMEDRLTAMRDRFVDEFMTNNESGIAMLDGDMTYEQLDPSKLYHVNPTQMAIIRNNIYRYFGVSEKIVDGVFTEDDWNAFYESILEPMAIQLSMETTQKLLTHAQRKSGMSIMYEANRLQYASAKTKIDLVDKLSRIGMLSVNEGREVFNLPPVEGGDRFVQSLNYKDVDGASDEIIPFKLGTE